MASMPVLEIDIDNVSKGIVDIERYGRLLEKAVEDGIDDLVGQMTAYLAKQLSVYGLDYSRMAQDLQVVPTPSGVSFRLSSDYWMFLEYGTGLPGKLDPHPNPSGWIYDSNNHGMEGWWYPTTSDDPNPTKYAHKETGDWIAWTGGRPSSPFMYNTWRYGSRIFTQVIRKHINRIKL